MSAGGPPGPVLRWLEREQSQNDRLFVDARGSPIDLSGATVRPAWRPESAGRWGQEVVWLPERRARSYGPVRAGLEAAFGIECPGGRVPLLIHPQPPRPLARLRARYGSQLLPRVQVSATSSFRSVLAWRAGREPVVLKLSLGAVVGRLRRAVTERGLVTALVVQRLLETIPARVRSELGFDWFAESAGVVHADSGTGWLLRHLPAGLSRQRGDLLPAFSLVASGPGGRSPLAEMIRRSGRPPEEVVVERVLRPYVRVLAYLTFEEGLHVQGHAQNVLLEADPAGELTGRVTLRDLSDVNVSLPVRIARGKPLPPLPRPRRGRAPFRAATTVLDLATARAPIQRARATVERYGLMNFVGLLNAVLARSFPRYDPRVVEDAYLGLWQEEATRRLGVKPLFRSQPRGLATDEAIALSLRHTDWVGLGAKRDVALPPGAEPLLIVRRARRRGGAPYARIDTEWGELYLEDDGLPVFFRPAR